MDVLLAAEAGLAHPGGSERFALELLRALSRAHRVRALVLGEPGPVGAWRRLAPELEVQRVAPPLDEGAGAWRRRRLRSERMRAVVADVLGQDPPDIVAGQLYAGGGALAAARAGGVPGALLLAGYEALCHWAFAVDSQCVPASRCRRCPRALALPARERAELLAVRGEQAAALATAACLLAPSAAMADACERIAGRRPHVAAPVTGLVPPVAAAPGGHVLAVSSVWSREKGVELLEPIARRLRPRPMVVQAPHGLLEGVHRALTALSHVRVRTEPAEIGPLLAGAGLVLVPSQGAEPFGRVAFEALSAGVPVLASDVGGLPDFVPRAQLVSPRDDPEAWAVAARRLESREAWEAARRRGMAAARAVVAGDPAGRIERALAEAVVRPGSRPAAGAGARARESRA